MVMYCTYYNKIAYSNFLPDGSDPKGLRPYRRIEEKDELHQDDLKKRMNSSFSSKSPSCKIASVARNLINSVSKQQRRPLPFLLYPCYTGLSFIEYSWLAFDNIFIFEDSVGGNF